MKKSNYFLLATICTLFFNGCANKGPEDPLLLPPNFESMPDINNNQSQTPKKVDPDTEKLRELLLKGS